MTNQLIHETSPYLLQHADNPVEWWPWSADALNAAKSEGKPIFLSIGYAACHWCHVMAHESFESEDTARIMNEKFINIKVDREERPDIDSIYMDAVVALTGQGGWPLSVFLTPEGKPFFGGTYFPPTRRYNIPSFQEVLLAIDQEWQENQDRVVEIGDRLTQTIAVGSERGSNEESLDPGVLDRSIEISFNRYDWRNGGWGGAPKFPQATAIETLLRRHHRRGDALALDMAIHALDHMWRGGIYDQVGGGFHRYAVDDHWGVPHFEKMLYDNAILIRTYVHAWQITGKPEFRRVVYGTIEFLMREMRHPDGGFFSSLDADSEGEEGTFYVWMVDDIRNALTNEEERELAIQAFGVTEEGNFEGSNVLYRALTSEQLAEQFDKSNEDILDAIEQISAKLRMVREKRPRPETDEKVITAWNGLLLTSLAEAAGVFDEPDFKSAAVALAEFLENKLWQSGAMYRSWRDGTARHTGYLEDHAAFALGCLSLYDLTLESMWYELAALQAQEILTSFPDPGGGFFDTRADHERLITRPKTIRDTPTPSGNSLAVELFLRMYALTGEDQYWGPAQASLGQMQSFMQQHPTSFAGWLNALDLAVTPQMQLAILGDPQSAGFKQLAAIGRSQYLPGMTWAGGLPNSPGLPPLAQNRKMIEDQPTAYLCEGFSCQLPTTDPTTLREQIAQATESGRSPEHSERFPE